MTPNPSRDSLDTLTFDNRFVRQLPADPEPRNFRRQVSGACYSRVMPTKVTAPELVAFSKEAARLIGLDEATCRSDIFTQVFTGNLILPGMDPFAMCYGGHQFGNWAGQLGDGRAINLGEVVDKDSGRWILQLKGAGPTPYSRTADGLAVLRSSIREFLCSEAMFHLGVPTTRALSLTLTGEPVERDMFYDGHPKEEPGAVVCRMAPSFTRFGNFQILSAREETDLLKHLMTYTVKTDFPHLNPDAKDIWEIWFREICHRTMEMVTHWMRVGFVHGVMNTDNMSILGQTIDYGPYGWLEDYDPRWTPNTTDASGRRYAFGNQPQIALWNLGQLANAILPVVGHADPLQSALDDTINTYSVAYKRMMAEKLGFETFEGVNDDTIINGLLALFQMAETDYTIFFRRLARLDTDALENSGDGVENRVREFLTPALYRPEQADDLYLEKMARWFKIYGLRLQEDALDADERIKRMNRVNPKYVLRNYLAQTAIEKAEAGDYSMVWELLDLIRHPYDTQKGKEAFAEKRPEWARHKPGCSMLSCSS
ncbi:MAG TPA: YdiU family protein [Desulfobacteraceae bacterium]|nr:YdiU family protein [Desulfobacteraceae bacterium]